MLVLGNAHISVFWSNDIHEEDSDVTDGPLGVELNDGIGILQVSIIIDGVQQIANRLYLLSVVESRVFNKQLSWQSQNFYLVCCQVWIISSWGLVHFATLYPGGQNKQVNPRVFGLRPQTNKDKIGRTDFLPH